VFLAFCGWCSGVWIMLLQAEDEEKEGGYTVQLKDLRRFSQFRIQSMADWLKKTNMWIFT
jgi:hypothetical protein